MRYRRAEHTAWRRIGEETVVINLATRRMVCLNGPAGTIWDRLEREAELSALAAALAPAAVAAATPVAGELVAALQREGLVAAAGAGEVEERGGGSTELPVGFVPPRITWSEELLRFGGACGKSPGAGGACLGAPQLS